MIIYEYRLEKDGNFRMAGSTNDRKYIDNLIKYKRRGKRYKLKVTKRTLVAGEEYGSCKLVGCEVIFEN